MRANWQSTKLGVDLSRQRKGPSLAGASLANMHSTTYGTRTAVRHCLCDKTQHYKNIQLTGLQILCSTFWQMMALWAAHHTTVPSPGAPEVAIRPITPPESTET